MHRRLCLLGALGATITASPSPAQIPGIPAKTVAETQIPVFADGARATGNLANFRLRIEFDSAAPAQLVLAEEVAIDLPPGRHVAEIRYEQHGPGAGQAWAEIDGDEVLAGQIVPGTEPAGGGDGKGATFESDDPALSLSGDFTAMAQFESTAQTEGTLFAKCAPGNAKWAPDAKALIVRGGKLVYDIGWLGAISGDPEVTDGKTHLAALVVAGGKATVFLDGVEIGSRDGFSTKDKKGFVFKVGAAAPNFGGDFKGGQIANVRFWGRALEGEELADLVAGKADALNTPVLNWSPDGGGGADGGARVPADTFAGIGHPGVPVRVALEAGEGFRIEEAWAQPLELADHTALISGWGKESLAEGEKIYASLCVTCHGTTTQEGTLPTALKFHEGEFKNGSDPYRLYQTLTKGYGLMFPQPQYNSAQKYALIHYLRETFLKPENPGQLFAIDEEYLRSLPRGLETVEEQVAALPAEGSKPYEKMDFGPALMCTYQVDKDDGGPNIAQKGIALRLDPGAGGVSKGKAWMLYDEDTMRVAAAYTGKFVDWRGIAFDGSHGTHTSIAGDPLFVNPDAPAWQNPADGSWGDRRVVGRDGRRYGPLPREWVHYKGIHYHGDGIPVIRYTVGEAEVLERPGLVEYGAAPLFTRTLNVAGSKHGLVGRIAPEEGKLTVTLRAPDGVTLTREEGHVVLRIPAAATPAKIALGFSRADEATAASLLGLPADLAPLTQGGPPRFGGKEAAITLAGEPGETDGAFAVDTIPVPNKEANPWDSWMRLGGFDFFPDNPDRAAVCTWPGDVWLVDGVAGDLKEVKWRRICSGLFQPLGLKIVDGAIYVTCRDQIARLHDLNGDLEIDHVENFNNDAQVTEHFHEFAMGLQTDAEGNFYYAKSARHALQAVVPHHGTLLRVSPDGSTTEIVATGFRAANGVCLNPDGTWIVTDQEGHWNPKNRINYVREGGFYGNMFGYHDVTDSADSAMEQPLCWITNAFDRSPAELLWVPEGAGWGALDGVLLNLSYGYGQVYTVPHEVLEDGQAQGGMCAFPIENFPTGIHRGRFHPENKALYVAGMFAWAGSQKADGGFFRIRPTGQPAYLPVKVEARKGTYAITFSDELPGGGEFKVTVWDLKRTASYGSKHDNERQLDVTAAKIDGATLTLSVPDLAPTMGMEVRCQLGNGEERVLHSSVHALPE